MRICADLCSSGLGGEPCGDFCFDLIPKQLPHQSFNDSEQVEETGARTGACPTLCENRLGYPLCKCQVKSNRRRPQRKIDFKKICDYFCFEQRWWLRGCPACESFQYGDGIGQNGRLMNLIKTNSQDDIDWGKWCEIQCERDNGGSACNCDILPFSLFDQNAFKDNKQARHLSTTRKHNGNYEKNVFK